mmetsp:Transcript_7369/g.29602  ORF Transcript_7369/g.29602 Transcript_7369/m.29602 type:complete len:215 (-) Transcript_7369:110-754(-)
MCSRIFSLGTCPPKQYSTIRLHMNAECVTTMIESSSRSKHQSRNFRARARSTGSGSRFSRPGFHNTSSSSSINEKSTPGNSRRYSLTLRRLSHGFPPICSRTISSATNFFPPRNRASHLNAGRSHAFIASALVASISTHPSPSTDPNIPAAVSIARVNGDTTTSSHVSNIFPYASRDSSVSLKCSHCRHPRAVSLASAYASLPYSFGSRSPARL